jgi:hypothetical protein
LCSLRLTPFPSGRFWREPYQFFVGSLKHDIEQHRINVRLPTLEHP